MDVFKNSGPFWGTNRRTIRNHYWWKIFKRVGKLEGLIYRGGTQTPDFYKGSTIGSFTKFLQSFIQDFVEGLSNYSLPRKHPETGKKLINGTSKAIQRETKTNQEQNMTNKVNIQFLREQLDKAMVDIEKLKDRQREFANGNHK